MIKKFNVKALATTFILTLVLGFSGSSTAFAATLPNLGAAATFSVLAQTLITGTTLTPLNGISGDVGNNNAVSAGSITALTPAMVAGKIYTHLPLAAPAEADIATTTVQADAAAQFNPGPGSIPAQGTNGTIVGALDGQTFTPGVYDDPGTGILLGGGTVTLDGAGVYIFRSTSTLTSSGTVFLKNGARACDVFWRVQTAAAINGTAFVGTILAGTGVHFGAGVTLNGRALAVGGDVTLNGSDITGPTCGAPAGGGSGSNSGTINVVKNVINDNGGTKTVADFPLFVSGTPILSGETKGFGARAPYTVTETTDPNYTQTFSGDCLPDGTLLLNPQDNKFCIITNDDIGPAVAVPPVPPLIDLVKVPSPLSLPKGPGLVNYTYTLTNIGTVPVTDITMVGDTCSPITLTSGDTNNDKKLDVKETWVYNCSTTLNETHTNTVVATGWANGISVSDIASATVVVGGTVPPLIHVTKIPSPLALPAGGGMVTYTNKVSNPGTVALSNITVMDDRCPNVQFVSGDTNNDKKLDPSETWIYTCRQNLTKTTTNTVTAKGEANGMVARDIAVAHVIVATTVPKLPNTGVIPSGTVLWSAVAAGLLAVGLLLYVIRKKKNL